MTERRGGVIRAKKGPKWKIPGGVTDRERPYLTKRGGGGKTIEMAGAKMPRQKRRGFSLKKRIDKFIGRELGEKEGRKGTKNDSKE